MIDPTVRLSKNGLYWRATWHTATGKKSKSIGRIDKVTKTVAKRVCAEMQTMHAVHPNSREIEDSLGLGNWLKIYFETRTDLSKRTVTQQRSTSQRLKRFFGSNRQIETLTRASAAEWRTWLSQSGLSEVTVCGHCRVAKTMFQHAKNQDRVVENVFDKLKGVAPTVDKDWRQLTDNEVARLISSCATEGLRNIIGLCAYAGLRRGEAERLEWRDVDFERSRITVRNCHPERIQTTKSKRREVFLEPQLAQLLRGYTTNCPSGRVVKLKQETRDIHNAIRWAGLEPWDKPLHTLRKYRTSSWLASGVHDISAVAEWIGDSVEVLMKHYRVVLDGEHRTGRQKVAESNALIAELRAEIAELKARP